MVNVIGLSTPLCFGRGLLPALAQRKKVNTSRKIGVQTQLLGKSSKHVYLSILAIKASNFRQAKDRYYDGGGGSLKDYPSTLGMHQMDNFSAIGSHITNNTAVSNHHKHMQHQESVPILSRAPSAMDAVSGMTGTMQSHLSQPTSRVMMPNGMIATAAPINGPMSASGVPQLLITAPSVSTLAGANLFGYPSQPLPPVPAPQVPMQAVNGMKRNMSTDSFLHHDESSGRGTDSSSGRPSTPPLKTSRPVTPVQLPPQPLGLPSNRAKLVPGRMSNHKLDHAANNSRPGSRRGEIPSTAV